MISHRRSNSRSRYVFLLLFLGVALVLGFVFRNQTITTISIVGKPILKSAFSVIHSTSFTTSLFGSKADLIKERDGLLERNKVLESESEERDLKEMYSEDIERIFTGSSDDKITASVLSRPNFTPYDSLLLDKGSNDGVTNGALLFGTKKRVIGFVARTYETLSHAVLFSTAGVESVVYIPKARVLVRAIGVGGGVMRLSIPQGIEVSEGIEVSYPTLSPSPIGKITRIVKTETSPDIFGYVTLSDSPFDLFVVNIGTSNFTSPSIAELEKNMEQATSTAKAYFEVPDGFKITVSTSTASTIGATTSSTTQ